MIFAWHGSGNKFDKFSSNFIGNGRGTAKEGWGFYFTAEKEVAKGHALQIGWKPAYIYKVELPNEENYFDWNALLKEQRPIIKRILYEVIGEIDFGKMDLIDYSKTPPLLKLGLLKAPEKVSGSNIYQGIKEAIEIGALCLGEKDNFLTDKAASEYLLKKHILGSYHKDKTSRSYTIYDENNIKIVHVEEV